MFIIWKFPKTGPAEQIKEVFESITQAKEYARQHLEGTPIKGYTIVDDWDYQDVEVVEFFPDGKSIAENDC